MMQKTSCPLPFPLPLGPASFWSFFGPRGLGVYQQVQMPAALWCLGQGVQKLGLAWPFWRSGIKFSCSKSVQSQGGRTGPELNRLYFGMLTKGSIPSSKARRRYPAPKSGTLKYLNFKQPRLARSSGASLWDGKFGAKTFEPFGALVRGFELPGCCP